MKDIAALHRAEYDVAPDVIAAAPGVVKFLGEHTEASDGLVLAAAISFEIQVAISIRRDSSLRFFAADLGERKRTSVGNLKFKGRIGGRIIPRASSTSSSGRACPPKAVNFTITGDIPVGLGLASSAALGLASALSFKELFGLNKRGEELADLARRAEMEFLGHPVPSYDHLTGAAPAGGTVSIVDLRTDRRRAVPFLDGNNVVVLTDSKVPRVNVDAELKQRAEDCMKCLAVLARGSAKTLQGFRSGGSGRAHGEPPRERAEALPPRRRRARSSHRGRRGPCKGRRGRLRPSGQQVSHLAAGNLYEVSCPEIDWLAKRAVEIDRRAVLAADREGLWRLYGSVMAESALPEYRKKLEDYERIFGFRPAIHETRLAGGLHVVG